MTSGEFVSLLSSSQAQGFGRPLLLSILSLVQDALVKHESSQTMAVDTVTGLLPLLTTRNNVMRYDLSVAMNPSNSNIQRNFFRISNVMLKKPLGNDYALEFVDYGTNQKPPANTTEPIEINGNWYYPYYAVKTEDALLNSAGSITGPVLTFSRNPGDTTNKFYIQGYMRPTPITSDRQQLAIPDIDGAHLMIVFPCFTKMIEARNNGNYEEAIEYITEKRYKLWEIMSKGAQGTRHKVTPRPY